MPDRQNYAYIEPADAEAEKACRLTRDSVALRVESPETFFAAAVEQIVLPNGYELRFADAPNAAGRINAFISDERECCPFFAFERWEEGGVHVLRILRFDDDAGTQEELPPAVLEGAQRLELRPSRRTGGTANG